MWHPFEREKVAQTRAVEHAGDARPLRPAVDLRADDVRRERANSPARRPAVAAGDARARERPARRIAAKRPHGVEASRPVPSSQYAMRSEVQLGGPRRARTNSTSRGAR